MKRGRGYHLVGNHNKGRSVVRPKRINGVTVPTIKSHKIFCDAWIKTLDVSKAAEAAGFTHESKQGHKLLKRYTPYLLSRKEKQEIAIAKEMALDQKDILAEMMAIGFANAQDYVVVTEEEIGGKIVKKRALKPIEELTRSQAAALSCVTQHPDGSVTYNIPDERSKHPYLKDLGQHLGLFHPKLIQEHRHRHMHSLLNFKDLDADKLAEAEQLLIDAMGPQGRRALGIVVDGEFEEVSEK